MPPGEQHVDAPRCCLPESDRLVDDSGHPPGERSSVASPISIPVCPVPVAPVPSCTTVGIASGASVEPHSCALPMSADCGGRHGSHADDLRADASAFCPAIPSRAPVLPSKQSGGSNFINVKAAAKWVPPTMVDDASPATPRKFTLCDVLRSKRVHNVRKAPPGIVAALMRDTGCVDAKVNMPLRGKTSAQVRRDLRRRLAESLAAKKHEAAFAKQFGPASHPRSDEIERLVTAFPAWHSID